MSTPSRADTNHYRPWALRPLVEELRAGRFTGQDAVRQSLDRIAATEPTLRAWVDRLAAPESTTRGPLGGVPLAVKDIIDLADLPTRCGSGLRAEAPPVTEDALIVSAWRLAGAVPLGKTVTTEFAYFSPGPTQNPAAIGHTPGGSSSGSAAAVASGQVPLALGSQTAGSVTRPASYCGVAALVMSHDRFATSGVTGLSPSLDSHGVFAARVTDLALAWSSLTGEPDVGETRRRPPRVLMWSAGPLDVVSGPMMAALEAARERLTAAGVTVNSFPEEQVVAEAALAHPVVMAYEAARERAAELSVASRLSPQLAGLLRTGAETSTQDYEAARAVIDAARVKVRDSLATYDAIIGPAAPGAAPAGLEATGDPVLSRPWQAMGLPVVAVPALTDGALPLGLQVVSRPRAETALLETACQIENALSIPMLM